VPTKEDHCQLVNGSTSKCSVLSGTFDGVDGWAYSGGVYAGSLYNYGSYGHYWSSTAMNNTHAYFLQVGDNGAYQAITDDMDDGFTLRCVQDAL
jgi:uncharacterized protein (TIGR02145 family)